MTSRWRGGFPTPALSLCFSACLPPFLSPTCIPFLVTAPSPSACFFFFLYIGLPQYWLRWMQIEQDSSRSYKHRDTPLFFFRSFFLCFLSFPLSLPHTLHRMTMNRMLSTVPAMDVCLALCLTLGIGCVPVFLSVCLTSLRACLSFGIAVCLPGHLSFCLPAKHWDTDQAGAEGT